MSISISANPAGARLLDATLSRPGERRNDPAMAAQDSATETQFEGLKPQHTMLDRITRRAQPARAVRGLVETTMAVRAVVFHMTVNGRSMCGSGNTP